MKQQRSNIQRSPSDLKPGQEDIKLLINILLCLVVSFLFFIAMELIQRGTVGAGTFIGNYKGVALLNYMLLFTMISPAILAKRAHFTAVILALPWVALSYISAMVTGFRGVPFSWSDIYSAGEALSIANQYITKEIIIKISIGTVCILILLTGCFFISFKVYRVSFVKRIAVLILMIGLGLSGTHYLTNQGTVDITQWDMAVSYDRNGFMYSFIESYLTTHRKQTDNYSAGAIEKVVESIEKDPVSQITENIIGISNEGELTSEGEKPNIIMVQLEAFCDPTIIKEAVFNEDPIPHFRKYFTEGYSGHLQVPTIGGATARTEFEVLTGVSLDYLSAGEIPYNSGLTSKEPIETIAYVLKEKGYATTAIHNFEGNFYSRHTAFKNLGFNRFIPMESMLNLVKYRAFPEDHVLVEYIKRAVETTDERDFILAITAGSHGPYSTTLNVGNEKYVSGPFEKETLHQLQNYTSLVRRTDQFIGELADYVYSLEEPTVLVVYSDHYPLLEATDFLTEKQKFDTPYFIIHNQGKLPTAQDKDIEAYQLSTEVFNLNQLKGGVMNIFHTAYRGKEDYQNNLELIQYDMLFGKKFAMNNKNPYTPTVIQIGLDKLEIKSVEYEDDYLIITGSGFTESSKIFMDNKLIETEFVNASTLRGRAIQGNTKVVQVKLLSRNNGSILDSNQYILGEE